MRPAKGSESELRRRIGVGIARVKRDPLAGEDEKSLKISLEQHVDMAPFAKIAAISHVAKRRVGRAACRGCGTSLERQPGGEIGHVVDARNGRPYTLTYSVSPKIAFLIPELRHQRPISITGG